jgi:hypothetical protein
MGGVGDGDLALAFLRDQGGITSGEVCAMCPHHSGVVTRHKTGPTSSALTNQTVGQQFTLVLVQDATGSRTVTWFSGIKWPGGTVPTLPTEAGAIDVFTFKEVSSGVYYGFAPGLNMS